MTEFHFLRPWWLLAVGPALLLGWRLLAANTPGRRWRGVIAPHLLPHLTVGTGRRRVGPAALLLAAWLTAVVALAGPTWEREPAPFADDAAVLVVVLKVTPSMTTEDIQPTRLARAVQKLHDLLALRPGAKTGLVAYAGSAHRVLPPTTDADVLGTFAGELAPDVMPAEGDDATAALTMADEMIGKTGQRGWVLWVADTADPAQEKALADYRSRDRAPVSVLAVAGVGPERDALARAAGAVGADLVPVTPDETDVRHLAGNTRFSAAADGTGERWRDAGYWLTPLLAAVVLVWFRPGWVARDGGGGS